VIEAIVLGRVGVDFTPETPGTSLADARAFVRAVGGFAGNIGTGLARLGVATAIVSGVGDDAHGEHVRAFLAGEGLDLRWLIARPGTRTQVAFFEARPPGRFPVTFYRLAPAPETLITAEDLADADLDLAPLVIVSAALLASEPARSATLGALERRAQHRRDRTASWTILDLDWRPTLWMDPAEAPALVERAARSADVLVGSDEEFAALGLDVREALGLGPSLIALKHGSDGASAVSVDGRQVIPGIPVDVVCGLGSGDGFTAAFGAGLLRGLTPLAAIERGNAAGAIVATRLMCSSAMPVPAEIDGLLARGMAAASEGRR
jgi:5-dehydro-2-deoxygluconokinase